MPLLDWLHKSHAVKAAACVRVVRDVETEGYRVRQGTIGTVVAVYGGGEAYAVEFENLDDGMGVVTLYAADLAEATT